MNLFLKCPFGPLQADELFPTDEDMKPAGHNPLAPSVICEYLAHEYGIMADPAHLRMEIFDMSPWMHGGNPPDAPTLPDPDNDQFIGFAYLTAPPYEIRVTLYCRM